jgi:polysaccharide biosynthesis/export protein
MKVRLAAKALFLLILFALPIISLPAIGGEREGAPVGAEYLLGVGDIIEVQVWKEEDLSRTLRVRLDGRITLPLIGDVLAAGKPPRELAAQIEEYYRETLAEPSVTVILNQSNQRYYVIGLVQQPGEFALDSHLTVLQALARSGGFQEWAKTSNIIIIRRDAAGEKILPFDYDAMIRRGDLSGHLQLAPGDTIVVP